MASGKVDEEKPAVSPAVSERAREESSDGTAAHELRDQHGEDVDKPVEDVKARVSKLVVSDNLPPLCLSVIEGRDQGGDNVY